MIISLSDREELSRVSDVLVKMPEVDELLSPIVYVVPLQLLAYHLAVLRGGNDPRQAEKPCKISYCGVRWSI